jgi:hypothetical protein
MFARLDLDGNKLLSKKELSAFYNGALTSVWIDRIFQEYPTKKGEMASPI